MKIKQKSWGKKIKIIAFAISLIFGILIPLKAQEYPFILPEHMTATINVNTSLKETYNNLLLGTNIHDLSKSEGQELVRDFNPITIRFPHGLFSNWYDWEQDKARVYGTETFQYDRNGTLRTQEIDYLSTIQTMDANNLRVGINELTALNNEKEATTGLGYDMLWTFNMSADGSDFSNGSPVSVARYLDLIGRGLQVKAIEMGNECFYPGQRSSIIPNTENYIARAKSMSAALKAIDPNVKLSIPLLRRESPANPNWNADLTEDSTYFDAITVHTYIGSDPDETGDSDEANREALTAREILRKSVDDYAKKVAPTTPIWLTEWGVKSGGPNAVSALGMADCYMFLSENQDTYERANWFSVNGKLNSHLVWHIVNNKLVIKEPWEKTSYGSTFEIVRSVFENSILLGSNMEVPTLDGIVNAVNARAVYKDGKTIIIAVNLTDQEVPFYIYLDDNRYYGEFEHKTFAFTSLTEEKSISYFSDPLTMVKAGKGSIYLPAYSINTILLKDNIILKLDFKNLYDKEQIDKGSNLTVEATAGDEFKEVSLYVNDTLLETKTAAPFSWTSFPQLIHMMAPSYRLKLVGLTRDNESIERTITITTPVQWAYTEGYRPHAVPGKIEAEAYDFGGENLAYYDKSEQSENYSYRGIDKVDLSGNGEWLKYIQGNEWLEYTVEVKRSGSYDLAVRHETRRTPEFEAMSFSFQESGEIIFGNLVCSYTGSGNNTIDTFSTAYLEKGKHILRLDILGYGYDMDFFEFILTSNPIDYYNVGTRNHPANPESYDSGNSIETLFPPLDSTGFDFTGWFTNPECTDTIPIPLLKTDDGGSRIFYAKWSPGKLAGTALIYGDIIEGNNLYIDTLWIENNSGRLLYQWQRFIDGEYINIEGAFNNFYTLQSNDIGSKLRVILQSSLQSGSVTSNVSNIILDASDTIFKISYDSNGGQDGLVSSEIVGSGGHPTFIARPTKDGYFLSAWTNREGEIIDEESLIHSDTTLFALWEVETRYKISFKTHNESIDILTDGYPAFVPYLPDAPVQTDSIFDIWITEKGERFDTSYMVFQDMEVFPAWKVKRFQLNVISLHGGIIVEPQQPSYEIHSTVKLTARPGSRYEFINWTGDFQSSDSMITVVMDSTINLTANYKELPYYALDVYSVNGEVIKFPNSSRYKSGFTVQLTAIPDNGYVFESWSGDYVGNENPLYITLTEDIEIDANFVKPADTTSIASAISKSAIQVVPNPNNGIFIIRSKDFKSAKYVLYTANGTEVQSGTVNFRETIEMKNKIAGIYLLELSIQEERKIIKLVIK